MNLSYSMCIEGLFSFINISFILSPQSAVRSPQSAVRSPQSAVRSPQSAVRSPQSAVRSPQSKFYTDHVSSRYAKHFITKTRTIILFTNITLNRLGFGGTGKGHFHFRNNETEDINSQPIHYRPQ